MALIKLTPLEEQFILATTESGHFWDYYTEDMDKVAKYGMVSGDWYCAEQYAAFIGCKKNAVRGIAGSLVRKGIMTMSYEGKTFGSDVDTWLNYTTENWETVLDVIKRHNAKNW